MRRLVRLGFDSFRYPLCSCSLRQPPSPPHGMHEHNRRPQPTADRVMRARTTTLPPATLRSRMPSRRRSRRGRCATGKPSTSDSRRRARSLTPRSLRWRLRSRPRRLAAKLFRPGSGSKRALSWPRSPSLWLQSRRDDRSASRARSRPANRSRYPARTCEHSQASAHCKVTSSRSSTSGVQGSRPTRSAICAVPFPC
jgi:hypothetical protein